MVSNGFCAMKEHSKVIFFECPKIKIFHSFSVLKRSEMDFALCKSTQKPFFVDLTFFSPMQYGGRKIQKLQFFLTSNLSKSLNGPKRILRYERALKSDFCGLHFCSTKEDRKNAVSEMV